MYYEVKCRYDKTLDNGAVKKVTETFITDALLVSDAEAKAIEYFTTFASGEFGIKAVKQSAISEVFGEPSHAFYLVKISYTALDEKSGVEKKTIQQLLVGADSLPDAIEQVKDHMKGSVSDWEFASVSESAIMDLVA